MPTYEQNRAAYLADKSTYDLARKRAEEQNLQEGQRRKDALTRRFAQLGNLKSGARVKQEQLAETESSRNLQRANEAIDAQQAAEMARRRELLLNQDFSSSEAEKQRGFATSERLGSQDFASGEAEKQRGFTTKERLGTQDFAFQQQQQNLRAREAEFARTYGLSLDQFKSAKEQFDKTFAEEVRVNDANIVLATAALNQQGFLEKLFDSEKGGIFGQVLGPFKNTIFGGSIGGAVTGAAVGGAGKAVEGIGKAIGVKKPKWA